MKYLELTIGAILVYNFVLARFLGICPFLGVSKRLGTAMGMSGAVVFVMTIASFITSLIYRYLLKFEIDGTPYDLSFLQVLLFILVIAGLVQLIEIMLQKLSPKLYQALGIYLPLITTNCGVLGVTMNVIADGMNYGEALLTALGCGLGFFLAMVLFSGVRSRVAEAEPPKSFEGLPITLVSAAIVSLSFFGLTGIIDRLFG